MRRTNVHPQVSITQISTADLVIMVYSESIQLDVNMYFYGESTTCNIDVRCISALIVADELFSSCFSVF